MRVHGRSLASLTIQSRHPSLALEWTNFDRARLVKAAKGVTGGQKGDRGHGNQRPAGEILVPRSQPVRLKSDANQL